MLLDTVAIIALATEPERVSEGTRRLLDDAQTSIHVSVVSLWEIAIKQNLGKLALPVPLGKLLDPWRDRSNVHIEPLDESTVLRLLELPRHHRDPFDRMLVCQARQLDVAIVSPDEVFEAYELERLW